MCGGGALENGCYEWGEAVLWEIVSFSIISLMGDVSGDLMTKYHRLKRRHFDLVIFALVCIYGAGFVILLMARLHSAFCELPSNVDAMRGCPADAC